MFIVFVPLKNPISYAVFDITVLMPLKCRQSLGGGGESSRVPKERSSPSVSLYEAFAQRQCAGASRLARVRSVRGGADAQAAALVGPALPRRSAPTDAAELHAPGLGSHTTTAKQKIQNKKDK